MIQYVRDWMMSLLLVKTMFSDSSSSTMKAEMANMQKQCGADDCEVFVIPAMVSLTFGEDL